MVQYKMRSNMIRNEKMRNESGDFKRVMSIRKVSQTIMTL